MRSRPCRNAHRTRPRQSPPGALQGSQVPSSELHKAHEPPNRRNLNALQSQSGVRASQVSPVRPPPLSPSAPSALSPLHRCTLPRATTYQYSRVAKDVQFTARRIRNLDRQVDDAPFLSRFPLPVQCLGGKYVRTIVFRIAFYNGRQKVQRWICIAA